MKTVQEQIANSCIHFNGIMNAECKAGVKYADVRVGRPYQFPCLNQGGQCDKCKFPTAEEVQAELKEIKDDSLTALVIITEIFKQEKKEKRGCGYIECPCGGTVSYSIAQINGHIRANCSECGISIME